MRHIAVVAAIMLLVPLLMPQAVQVVFSSSIKPVALGLGYSDRYVLYEDGSVYSLSTGSVIGRINLNEYMVDQYMIDFEVANNNLYLYAYKNLNASTGETHIFIYHLSTGEALFHKIYRFNVVNNAVYGELVLNAIASRSGLAVLISNSTHTLIEVYKVKEDKILLTGTYNGKVTMMVYRYGDTFLAATFTLEYRNNAPWIVPRVVDLLENRTLFSIPSLIPVMALAYPFIQVFSRNGNWECYVTVYNPVMSRMEHYVVYPDKYDLVEHYETVVSPYMDYVIVKLQNTSRIVFKDDVNITVNYKLSIIPQGVFIALDPGSGILDVDMNKKAILAKIIKDDVAKIIYIEKDRVVELLELDASEASKVKGFYGVLVGDKAHIIIPSNASIVSIELSNFYREAGPNVWLLLALVVIVVCSLTISWRIILKKRCMGKKLAVTL